MFVTRPGCDTSRLVAGLTVRLKMPHPVVPGWSTITKSSVLAVWMLDHPGETTSRRQRRGRVRPGSHPPRWRRAGKSGVADPGPAGAVFDCLRPAWTTRRSLRLPRSLRGRADRSETGGARDQFAPALRPRTAWYATKSRGEVGLAPARCSRFALPRRLLATSASLRRASRFSVGVRHGAWLRASPRRPTGSASDGAQRGPAR
jgi:hypothetical protein